MTLPSDNKEHLESEAPKYVVTSVIHIETPAGVEGDNWCEYIISCGKSVIQGKRQGSISEVNQHAQSVASDLNNRSGNKGKTSWVTRQNKP